MMKRYLRLFCLTSLFVLAGLAGTLQGAPLKIGYSDWPGWVAWEIAIKKGWFKDAGVDVEFVWMDYVKSMEAYAAGQLDGTGMTNGDALVTGATGKASVCILINDYSNGNDMIIVKPGIEKFEDLKGKTVGIEEGYVVHLLLLKALELSGMQESDVKIKNTPTNNTPQVLASGEVDAIGAWQPSSGEALKVLPGSKAVYTSKNVPGLIYDCLYVDPKSLAERREEWKKVIQVWYKVVQYIKDENNIDEVLSILSTRVGLTPDEYEPLLNGTHILTPEEVSKVWEKAEGLGSIYGSSKVSDDFNVKYKVYEKPMPIETYLDPSLTKEVLGK